MTLFSRTAALAVLLTVAACAEVPSDPLARAAYDEANDPAEPTNRVVFAANQAVDRTIVKPVASAYNEYVPNVARAGIHNFSSNLGEPSILVNDLLQGNFSSAFNTTARFMVNTTAGGAGLVDVASMIGLPRHEADFGQTFGVWGIGPGPAVQLPLLGSSNVRDSMGMVVGFVANPLNAIPGSTITMITTAGGAGGLLSSRSALLGASESLEKSSLDYYVTLRSVAAQRRASLVEEGLNGYPSGEVTIGEPSVDGDPASPPAGKAK